MTVMIDDDQDDNDVVIGNDDDDCSFRHILNELSGWMSLNRTYITDEEVSALTRKTPRTPSNADPRRCKPILLLLRCTGGH